MSETRSGDTYKETDTWYIAEYGTPRNGHWYPIYSGASRDEARFALWGHVEQHPNGALVRVRQETG